MTEITKGFLAISSSTSGGTYMGAMGAPDFDTASGAANSVGAVYCYDKDGTNTVHPRYDALRYDRTTGRLNGTFGCFIGF